MATIVQENNSIVKDVYETVSKLKDCGGEIETLKVNCAC